MIKKAIITAAGFGSRFLPWTKTVPKEFLPIFNKPAIHLLVEECIEANIEEVIIVTQESYIKIFSDYFFGEAKEIRDLLLQQNKIERLNHIEEIINLSKKIKIKIVQQNESLPYGSGRPILSVKKELEQEDAFAVIFGDDLLVNNISGIGELIKFYESVCKNEECHGAIAVQQVELNEVSKYGIVEIENGSVSRVKNLVEKPSLEKVKSNLASYGRFILTPVIFQYLTQSLVGVNKELGLQDANSLLIQNGYCMHATQLTGRWVTIGDPVNYVKALQEYSKLEKNKTI